MPYKDIEKRKEACHKYYLLHKNEVKERNKENYIAMKKAGFMRTKIDGKIFWVERESHKRPVVKYKRLENGKFAGVAN